MDFGLEKPMLVASCLVVEGHETRLDSLASHTAPGVSVLWIAPGVQLFRNRQVTGVGGWVQGGPVPAKYCLGGVCPAMIIS